MSEYTPENPETFDPEAQDIVSGPERQPRRGRSVPTNVLIPMVHREALRRLSAVTRVSQSEYLREAVTDLLRKYRHVVDEERSRKDRLAG
ncbi:MAG: ribbon-helix-helix domain-containing protein [Deltaproteobacteria bacterium]|nr:ribbon-helix-helix domain-containing protein [Deltaproteobacteria bacterium]